MRVCTVPASAPFLRSVIAALVDGTLIDGFSARATPEALASATLYLPTRRACRVARDVFLDVLGADALLLPRIVALGEVDEDEIAFAQAASNSDALTLPPAVSALERRLWLAQLVGAWIAAHPPQQGLVAGPAAAFALADDLARLIDDMATRNVPWKALEELVPDNVDAYWQESLNFLNIAAAHWPQRLHELGKIDAAVRRDRLIAAEAARLRSHDGPVIAAGSTGSMPSTAAFLEAVARLPQGAVVLPGLDMHLDDESWQTLTQTGDGADELATAPGHPQYALHGLLERFKLKRGMVRALAPEAARSRDKLVSEAMRPATSTALWHQRLSDEGEADALNRGMDGIAMIEAANSEDEALAIAVALREAHERNLTAALVTPDRALARRVVAALERWNLIADDSGGDPLTETSAGRFARLIAEAATQGLAPITLLAMLKHPLFRLGRAAGGWAGAIATLECAVLRGVRPPPGSQGLRRAFAAFHAEWDKQRSGSPSALHRSEPRAALDAAALDEARALIEALTSALLPLETTATRETNLAALTAQHGAAVTALSTAIDGPPAAFDGADGAALAAAFDDIAALDDAAALPLHGDDYADAFVAVFADRSVRRASRGDGRLRIFGPLEARLTECDRIVLGGLVEGVWPPQTDTDAWLNRPMRRALGLDLPERRIGLSAHDFAQLLGHTDVILARASKREGAPAVASRFLNRLKAVAGETRWQQAVDRGSRYLAWSRALDRPDAVMPVPPPQPKPPCSARPLRLSVTEIEHWLRDPYTIFAKHILQLPQLDAVDLPLGAADRGTAIHGAIGDFTAAFARRLPDDPLVQLVAAGQQRFAALGEQPEARALWWPRFQRIAAWFVAWEQERRAHISEVHAEISGRLVIPLGDRAFILTARADRIDRLTDGSYAIVDYKTGAIATAAQVLSGVSPQLTLEAAILQAGGFAGIPAKASVGELMYVRLSGGEPAGEADPLVLKRNAKDSPIAPDAAAQQAQARLVELVQRFDDPNTPYRALVMPMWKHRYGTYDHLARVKEWSDTGGTADGDDA